TCSLNTPILSLNFDYLLNSFYQLKDKGISKLEFFSDSHNAHKAVEAALKTGIYFYYPLSLYYECI
ncbi:MAG: hypothetical protein ACTTJ4_00005, partial [Treponema sp.]|uniref:hypothetical protein n=1 Tax=Treponema sp. TaxID=166 RepID=UPI003FA1AEA4